MPDFELAKAYAKQNRLVDNSSRYAQGIAALKSLSSAEAVAAFEWRSNWDSSHFDHTRVFTKSPNAAKKAWRVGFSPYRSGQRLSLFEEVADALQIDVLIGDPAHRTFGVDNTIPVMYFRRS